MPQSSLTSWLQWPKQSTLQNTQVLAGTPKDAVQDRKAPQSNSIPEHPAPSLQTPLSTETDPSEPFVIPFTIPPNATIQVLRKRHLKSYRRLNALLLPIPYQESFYKQTLNDPVIASVTRIATWNTNGQGNERAGDQEAASTEAAELRVEPELVVAAIRCRILESQPQDPSCASPVLYISTIGTLAPFRGHQLATHLLAEVTRIAIKEHNVRAVMGHVWEANEEVMGWYMKRGFEIVACEKDYYRSLAPKTGAWLIRKNIGIGTALQIPTKDVMKKL